MTNRSRLHRPARSATPFGLDHLEPRRMLDCSCPVEMIEITRLDGGESFWVRADDPVWGVIDPVDCPEDETADPLPAVEPESDHSSDDDLYDFGQPRGEQIDDDAEYDPAADDGEPVEIDEPALTERGPEATVPAQPEIAAPDETEAVGDSETLEDNANEPVRAIAIIPAGGKVSWLGDDQSWAFALGFTLKEDAKGAAPVVSLDAAPSEPAWTDIAALPA